MIHIIIAADKTLKHYFSHCLSSVEQFYENIIIYDLGGLGVGNKVKVNTSSTANQKFPKKPLIILDALTRTNEEDFLIWLDCDTILVDKLDEVFFKNFDLGVTIRKNKSKKPQESWINSGVIFFKNNKKTHKMLKTWASLSDDLNGDQYSLNKILDLQKPKPFEKIVKNDTLIKLLPCKIYNNFYFKEDQSKAKILHYKSDVRSNYPYKKLK